MRRRDGKERYRVLMKQVTRYRYEEWLKKELGKSVGERLDEGFQQLTDFINKLCNALSNFSQKTPSAL